MARRDMIDLVRAELAATIPRGPRNSRQNIARMIYWMLRMNSLGAHPEVAGDPHALRSMAFRLAATPST
jgi:hypothetical protein